MSVVTAQYVTSPFGESEIASCFIIGDVREEFTLFDVSKIEEEYTLSFWVKSDISSNIVVNGTNYASSTAWKRHEVTFTATSTDIEIKFGAPGTYYIYHIQLELGDVAKEWSVSPKDIDADVAAAIDKANGAQETADDAIVKLGAAESAIKMLSDRIQTLVRDENGTSLMTQVGGEWIFNMGKYDETLRGMSGDLDALTKDLGDAETVVNALRDEVDDLGIMTEYVVIKTIDGQPCIELGKIGSNFKVRITNTEIQFLDGESKPAYLSNQKLMIEKAEVKNELQFGGFSWTTRANGNMGIVWKGADS